MGKKKTALLVVVLLLSGALMGAGATYTFSNINQIKSAYKKADAETPSVGGKLKDLLPDSFRDAITDHQSEEDDTEDVPEEPAANEPAPQEKAEAPQEERAGAPKKPAPEKEKDLPIQTPSDAVTTASDNPMEISQIVQKCLPSVVAITNKGVTEIRSMWGTFTQDSESSGSGVIIGQTDTELLILTNYHVVEDSEQLSVVFSWEENQEKVDERNIITAQIKDYDSARDIAVIAIAMDSLEQSAVDQITVASIGDSDNLLLGQQVVAIGNALGYGQSVTTGIVSAVNRTVESGNSIGSANKYIQTDAAINPGNSGGALFNMHGELIGINSAKIATSTVEGMGYAIPISDIMNNVETMMSSETRTALPEEERGILGVNVIDVTSDISQAYDMPTGVYISETVKGGGAAKSGLKKGDIITGINGKTVVDTTSLKKYLSYYGVGETVTVTVERQSGDNGYQTLDIPVTLSKNTEPAAQQKPQEQAQEQAPEQDQNDDIDSYDLFDFLNPFGSFGW